MIVLVAATATFIGAVTPVVQALRSPHRPSVPGPSNEPILAVLGPSNEPILVIAA